MKNYNISAIFIRVINHLYDEANSAVLFIGGIETASEQQLESYRDAYSHLLFDIFTERIMTNALKDHEGTVSIGGRTITNPCFANDIDGLAEDEEELAKLVECLDKASTAYGMEIIVEKTKLMTYNTSGINKFKVSGRKFEIVRSLKYLGSTAPDEDSKPGILSRFAQTTAALKNSLQRQEHFCQFLDTTDALPCHTHFPVCL